MRRDMKRGLLIFLGIVLVICLVVSLAMVFSAQSRLAGVVGLGVVAISAIAWVLVLRGLRAAARPRDVPPCAFPGAEDLDEATSLRSRPTWRDDANGRVGPHW